MRKPTNMAGVHVTGSGFGVWIQGAFHYLQGTYAKHPGGTRRTLAKQRNLKATRGSSAPHVNPTRFAWILPCDWQKLDCVYYRAPGTAVPLLVTSAVYRGKKYSHQPGAGCPVADMSAFVALPVALLNVAKEVYLKSLEVKRFRYVPAKYRASVHLPRKRVFQGRRSIIGCCLSASREDCTKLATFIERAEGLLLEVEKEDDMKGPGWQSAFTVRTGVSQDAFRHLHNTAYAAAAL